MKYYSGDKVNLSLPSRSQSSDKDPFIPTDEVVGLPKQRRQAEYLARRTNPKTFWEFFDLGTRLVSVAPGTITANSLRALNDATLPSPIPGNVNAYIELAFDAVVEFNGENKGIYPEGIDNPYSFASHGVQVKAGVSTNAIKAWDDVCLGIGNLDPLGKTVVNGDTKEISNCMPLWYGQNTQQDVEITNYTYSGNYNPDAFDIEVTKIVTTESP